MITSAACANSAFSYLPTTMSSQGREYLDCKGQPICINIVEIGGNQNIVSGIKQECGVINNVENFFGASPSLTTIAIILFIIFIILLFVKPSEEVKQLERSNH